METTMTPIGGRYPSQRGNYPYGNGDYGGYGGNGGYGGYGDL